VRLLLDTHLLVWLPLRDPRLSRSAVEAIASPDNSLSVSAVTAAEFTDLQRRGRIEVDEPIDALAAMLGYQILDLPAEVWRTVADLPCIHRDPVDRMLVAHAIAGGFTLVTADRTLRNYPVPSLW
jgi:PIN domain nuclease of toxin-antitoxin system